MIRVTCPACGREFEFADFLAGLTAVCKNCTHRIPVPAAQGKTPPPEDAIQPTSETALPPPTPVAYAKLTDARSVVKTPVVSGPMPDWAIEQARLLLDGRMSVPEIEKKLVDRGLSPVAATAVVDAALEDRARRQGQSVEDDERLNRIHRTLSGVVAGGCVLLAYIFFNGLTAGKTVFYLLLPLALIWFPNAMNTRFWRQSISPNRSRSGGVVVRWAGWALLLVYFSYRVAIIAYVLFAAR